MNVPGGGKDPPRRLPVAAALADFIVLNEEIAAIVRARLPLETHLAQLGKELTGKAGPLAQRVGQRMERGESLTEALDAECASMPAAYRAVLLAGLQSNQLGTALESLVDTASRLDQLRRITGVAILYPLVILIVACLLLALIVSRVIPTFDWLNQPHFGALSWLADSPWTVPILAVGLPALAVISAAISWRRAGQVGGGQRSSFGLLKWLPGTQRILRWSHAATFAELLMILVKRGLPLDHALRLAGGAAEDARLGEIAERLADEIRRGAVIKQRGASAAAGKRPEFPLLIRLALHHAGNRNLLVGGLRQAADVYRERAVRTAEWYAEYLPMLLTVAIGGTLTAAFTLLVLWPYVSTLHELSGWNWR
jgi:general secretion pathway protein F